MAAREDNAIRRSADIPDMGVPEGAEGDLAAPQARIVDAACVDRQGPPQAQTWHSAFSHVGRSHDTVS